MDQLRLVGHLCSPLPFRIEPLTDERIVNTITTHVDVPSGRIGDTSAPIDRHVKIWIGVVDDVAVRRTDQLAYDFSLLAKDDGRSSATIARSDVISMAEDLEMHQVVRVVVSHRSQAKIPRAENVGHLMRTLSVGVKELSHVAKVIPATNKTSLLIVKISKKIFKQICI